jgi:hypothetical protein
MADLLKRGLEEENHRVTVAQDARTALCESRVTLPYVIAPSTSMRSTLILRSTFLEYGADSGKTRQRSPPGKKVKRRSKLNRNWITRKTTLETLRFSCD